MSICVNPCLKKEDVFREGLEMEKEKTNLIRQSSVISHRSSVIRQFETGSAFILVVVLTTLLMLIGVVFLMSTRIEKLSTSAVSQEKDLQSAVGAVVEQVSQQLVWDSPGIDPNQEYYDYPDILNPWLASLEPEPNGTNYQWRQISNIYPIIYDWYNTGYSTLSLIEGLYPSIEDYPIINDYQADITIGLPADSDGDGVADSRWVMIPDISTIKGEPVLAAVRVIDNSAMLNVNTAYKFDPSSTDADDIDGSSQLQVNLFALSARDKTHSDTNKVERLLTARNWDGKTLKKVFNNNYENSIIWNFGNSTGSYTPYDISDELRLRNRYILNYNIGTRIEALWTNCYELGLGVPRTDVGELADWFERANTSLPNSAIYDYRHISTTNNLDRVINPFGDKMINVNKVDSPDELDALYGYISIDMNVPALAGPIAVNLKDMTDSDADVSFYDVYRGFEQPCIFISELAHSYLIDDPYNVHHSFAIELYKHFPANNNDQWQIVLPGDITVQLGDYADDSTRYFVVLFEDPCVPLEGEVIFSDSPADGEENVDPNVILSWPPLYDANSVAYDVYFGIDHNSVRDANNKLIGGVPLWLEYQRRFMVQWFDPINPVTGAQALTPDVTYYWRIDDVNSGGKVIFNGPVWSFTVGNPKPVVRIIGVNDVIFARGDVVSLVRVVDGTAIVVDQILVPEKIFDVNYANAGFITDIVSYQREISEKKFIKRLWQGPFVHTLGRYNGPADAAFAGVAPLQVFFGQLNNIGELGKVFKVDVYDPLIWNASTAEENVRINLLDPVLGPAYQGLFNYLTRIEDAGGIQTRVKGRININTAPWFVLAQLPWVSMYDTTLAQAIANGAPFESIGQLMNIAGMCVYGFDKKDQLGFPDLSTYSRTKVDDVLDDFEERDLIFARISDLVTVRSDVFTAYILVRLGQNGPQKRVMAILDRSDVRPDPVNIGQILGKVEIRALYEVPDPR